MITFTNSVSTSYVYYYNITCNRQANDAQCNAVLRLIGIYTDLRALRGRQDKGEVVTSVTLLTNIIPAGM